MFHSEAPMSGFFIFSKKQFHKHLVGGAVELQHRVDGEASPGVTSLRLRSAARRGGGLRRIHGWTERGEAEVDGAPRVLGAMLTIVVASTTSAPACRQLEVVDASVAACRRRERPGNRRWLLASKYERPSPPPRPLATAGVGATNGQAARAVAYGLYQCHGDLGWTAGACVQETGARRGAAWSTSPARRGIAG